MNSLLRQWPSLLLVIGFTGYLEYLATRDLIAEIAYIRRTGIMREYIVTYIGLISFYAAMQALFLISLAKIESRWWKGPVVVIPIAVIFVGMVSGGKRLRRIRRKHPSSHVK